MPAARRSGVAAEVWEIVHLPGGTPADPAAGRLELVWRDGFPVTGRLVPPGGPGRAHPAPPAGTTPAARRAGAAPPDLRLSVVVPTRDREEDLARCLASFARQSRPPDEIIVVDNASRGEGTRAAATAAGATYVREDRPGLDIARNAGVRAATGAVIAFCDDDVVLHAGWCREIVAAFADPALDAVTGLVLPLELATPAQRIFETDWSFGRGFEPIDFGPDFFRRTVAGGCPAWLVGAGASMAFRREVFVRLGLFDERLDAGAAGCSGDSEMWYRILASGGTCRYEPRVVSFHRHRTSMADLRRQIRAYMRGHVAALLVQHQRFGHRGNLRRAFWTLPRGYLRRLPGWLGGRLRRGPAEGDLLADEVRGFLGGFLYFARHPRLCSVALPAEPPAAEPEAREVPGPRRRARAAQEG